MIHHSPLRLKLGKKLLLAATAVLAVFGPLVFGFTNPSPTQSLSSPASKQADNPITCASGDTRYPEGTVIQMGDEPEQMCVRVLDPVDPKNPDAPLKYSPQWIHTSKVIRERSATVVHLPVPPLAVCSPKASTQKNLCACEGMGDFSQGALVNSAKGSFQLRCKEGKWLQTDRPNIERN